MEQFKICEKETKTKAYSKEGLAREAKMDPLEAEKEDKRQWLSDVSEQLSDAINATEAEVEKLSSGRGKTKNKEQIERLMARIKRSKAHIAKLEQVPSSINFDVYFISGDNGLHDDDNRFVGLWRMMRWILRRSKTYAKTSTTSSQ